MQHDQRFKTLIRHFLREFFELFFTDWLDLIDMDQVEWLEQELTPEPPDGKRYVLDLVAKAKAKQPLLPWHDPENPEWIIAILVEIEAADSSTDIRGRIPKYSWHLRTKLGQPVLPIVIFLNVGLDGIGKLSHTLMVKNLVLEHSECLYVGLPGMDALQYIEGENCLGIALSTLMRVPPERVAWLGAEALRKLIEAPLDNQRKFMLGECVRAYLPMTDNQRREFEELLNTRTYSEVKAVNVTIYEEGLMKGEERGEQRGELIGMLSVFLNQRFGKQGTDSLPRIRKIKDLSVLESLIELVSKATDWAEFEKAIQ